MRILITVALLLSSFTSEAQVFDWLKDNIQVRKAFDGSKNEQRPGNITLESSDPGETLYSIDLAAKFLEQAFHEGDQVSIYGYPSVEWHKSTIADKDGNTMSGKGNVELLWLAFKSGGPLAIGNAGYKYDFEKGEKALEWSVLLSPYFASGGPGFPVKNSNNDLILQYFLYIGHEFRGSTINGKDLKTLLLRGEIELYPFSCERMQLIGQLVHRRQLNHLSEINKNLWLGSIELNFYFDTDGHYGIGYSWQNGRSPEDNFKKIKKSSIAFKMKF